MKKKATKKLPAIPGELAALKRKLVEHVCLEWARKIRAVKTWAQAERLWATASMSDRHHAAFIALRDNYGELGCPICMGKVACPRTLDKLRRLIHGTARSGARARRAA